MKDIIKRLLLATCVCILAAAGPPPVPTQNGGTGTSVPPAPGQVPIGQSGGQSAWGTLPGNSGATTVYAANYGVVPDRVDVVADLNITATSTAATTTTTSFRSSDCQTGSGCTGTGGNKIILVTGAGPTGYALLTTVAGFTNAHAVTLANAATTTVVNANFSYGSNLAPQINAAITAATTLYPTGAKVELPSGPYVINPAVGQVTLASNISLESPGKGAANILCASLLDSSNLALNPCIYGTGLTNVAVKNLTVKGLADVTPTRSLNDISSPIYVISSTNVEYSGNRMSYMRTYSLEVDASTTVTIANNWISYSRSNGTGCGGCFGDVLITGNHIDHTSDSSVAVSTGDMQAAPSGIRNLVVNGNSVTESVGMQISGGRSINITNNSLIRMVGQAIWVFPFTDFNAGDTATSAVNITGNTVQDVINSAPGQALIASFDSYVIIGGGQRRAGTGTSVPGYPTVGTGVVTDLYGTNTSGNFFANNTNNSSVASPGSIGWNISNNVFVRTLPAVASYSQWGYGSIFWSGKPNTGTYTGPIAEGDLELPCITVREQPLRLSAIHDNVCATTGDYGIVFLKVNPAVGDYDQLRIYGNTFYDYNRSGINFAAVQASSSEIEIIGNSFNADPRFRSPQRGTGGTWTEDFEPQGIRSPFMSGLRIDKNTYRNLDDPYFFGSSPPASVWIGLEETLFALPRASSFSTLNVGVGVVSGIIGAKNLFRLVCEDGDPRSATFGQIFETSSLMQATVPTSGCWLTGTFVTNTIPTVDAQGRTLVGWKRLTTSSVSNVDGTDWSEIYSSGNTSVADIRNVVGTTDTILSSDMVAPGVLISYSNSSPISVTLPQAGTTGFEQNKCFHVSNIGTDVVTITPVTSLINGSASASFSPGAGGTVCSGGSNYVAY